MRGRWRGADPPAPSSGGEDNQPRTQKLKIKLADGKERAIQHMTATTFRGVDGRPMPAAEFITRLFGELPRLLEVRCRAVSDAATEPGSAFVGFQGHLYSRIPT